MEPGASQPLAPNDESAVMVTIWADEERAATAVVRPKSFPMWFFID